MNINILMGKTLKSVDISKEKDEIIFKTEGEMYKMYHEQECSETVTIEDICGDVSDLLSSPITMAESVSSSKDPDDKKKNSEEEHLWTFYKLATIKGFVTIRWYGESDYYSTEVIFSEVAK